MSVKKTPLACALLLLAAFAATAAPSLTVKPGCSFWSDAVGFGALLSLEYGDAFSVPGLFMISSLGGFFTAADGLGASLLSLGGGAGYLVAFGGGLALAPSLQLGIARMQRSGLSGRSDDAIGFLLYPAVDVRYTLDRSLDLGLGLGPQMAWNGRWHVVNINLLVSVSLFLGDSRN